MLGASFVVANSVPRARVPRQVFLIRTSVTRRVLPIARVLRNAVGSEPAVSGLYIVFPSLA